MTATAATITRTASDEEIASVEEQLRLLFVRVRAVWKEAAAAVHPELQPVGYKILSVVVRRGPMHAGALAVRPKMDKSNVTRRENHLETLVVNESVVGRHDRRARYNIATP